MSDNLIGIYVLIGATLALWCAALGVVRACEAYENRGHYRRAAARSAITWFALTPLALLAWPIFAIGALSYGAWWLVRAAWSGAEA